MPARIKVAVRATFQFLRESSTDRAATQCPGNTSTSFAVFRKRRADSQFLALNPALLATALLKFPAIHR